MNPELREKIKANTTEDHAFGCWLWKGKFSTTEHATIRLDGKMKSAHKAVYEEYHGPVVPGLVVAHICGITTCVNPDHLMMLEKKEASNLHRVKPTFDSYSPEVSLKDRIRANSKIDPDYGCWLWGGSTQTNGYAQIRVDGKVKLVHRVAYEAYIGPIPKGQVVTHTCPTPTCVNPNHLQLATQTEAMEVRKPQINIIKNKPAFPEPYFSKKTLGEPERGSGGT